MNRSSRCAPQAEVAVDRVRHDTESLESYFKCALAKDESIALCKAYRVGTHDSTDSPRPVKIILGSVEEKEDIVFGNARLFFHQSYGRA